MVVLTDDLHMRLQLQEANVAWFKWVIANTTWFTFHKVHCNKIAKGARMRVHHTTALTSMRCCTEGTVRNQQLHQAPNSVWVKIFE